MGERRRSPLGEFGLAAAFLLPFAGDVTLAENIDPGETGDQYAWGENVGWINAEPLGNGGSGVQVEDFEVTGWMWGETIGWISMSCENTASCASTSYGVTNDGFGSLGGYAWGENIGWINFGSSGAVPFRVKTGWCQTTAAPPGSGFTLTTAKSGGNVDLSWTPLADASWYDVVRGTLSTLRSTGGDFAASTAECIADKLPATAVTFAGPPPAPGDADWFLVRGSNCKGHGTYDTGLPSQLGSRDAEIAASGEDCE